jgi:hypothetical protein
MSKETSTVPYPEVVLESANELDEEEDVAVEVHGEVEEDGEYFPFQSLVGQRRRQQVRLVGYTEQFVVRTAASDPVHHSESVCVCDT